MERRRPLWRTLDFGSGPSSLGYRLEERAIQAIGGWKFSPARGAARRPVAAWVTIEAVFQLL